MATSSASRSFDAQRRLVGLRLGRYVLGPRLGAGGTASVYLAREASGNGDDKLVGLKVIHDHLLEEGDFVRMFIDEANLAQRMSHPNVVKVFEFGREGESLYLSMEYLHGQPLSKLFDRLAERRERLPFELVMWIGARVAEGLDHAHQLKGDDGQPLGLIHRDVSPQNVFVTYDGEVKLIDFGIAKAEGRLAKTTLGRIKGKFAYMAPEQVLGNNFDQRADLFALGATLYELTIGVRLFAGEDQTDTLQKLLFEQIPNLSDRDPNVPVELSTIIRKALASELNERYASAKSISQDLDALLTKRGMTNRRAALAQLMTTCFKLEMEERSKSIEKLLDKKKFLGESRSSSSSISGEPGTPSGIAAIRSAEMRRARRRPLLAAGALGALITVAAAVTALVVGLQDPAESNVVSPETTQVTFGIQVQPDVDSTITVNGNVITQRPATVVFGKGSEPVQVVVTADGFETQQLSATPDRNQLLSVRLVKKTAPIAMTPPMDPAKPDAGVAPKNGKTPPVVRSKVTGPKSTGTGSLVTEYPF